MTASGTRQGVSLRHADDAEPAVGTTGVGH
jgi:hypothetical protein